MISRRVIRAIDILRCYLGTKDRKEISLDLLWDEDEYGPLRSNEEIDHAVCCLEAMGLPVGNDRPKAWDRYRIFSYIIRHVPVDCPILDGGCGRAGGYLLYYLREYGYKKLYGCDLVSYALRLGAIKLSRQNIEATTFPDNKFAVIACISVIEHGVDIRRFFKEMYRILKPGGSLLLSTDYWCNPIATEGIYPYGREAGEMKVFIPQGIKDLQRFAEEVGFVSLGKVALDCGEAVVEWQGQKFTFILCGWAKSQDI